ncbi:hypothetical protein TorRG33x02_299030 [Trema orientale]|uniref:Glycine rich protein n=1 Tax=Trema orientale TaxID=63057 RepID=A0A2P5C3B5_TREOI|nr:hypothetical protein TorRG33x02_299030 [Trema orientale]
MAKWCIVLVLALVVVYATARNVPVPTEGAGLNDQKTLGTYGGVGGYSGIGNNGLPFGGVGGATGGNIGGLGAGIGGGIGLGGPGGLGGRVGPGIGGGNGVVPFIP